MKGRAAFRRGLAVPAEVIAERIDPLPSQGRRSWIVSMLGHLYAATNKS